MAENSAGLDENYEDDFDIVISVINKRIIAKINSFLENNAAVATNFTITTTGNHDTVRSTCITLATSKYFSKIHYGFY